MPFLIPAIPYLAAIVAAGGVAAAAVVIGLTVLEIVAMSLLVKLLAPSQPGSQLSNGATEEYSGTVEPRRIVYGMQLIGGLNAIPPWCHGKNNEMLDQVLVLAGHECTAITDIFINQEKVLSSSIGPVTGSLNDGLINTGSFANKVWVRRYPGIAGETVDYILHSAWPGSWDPAHIGTGLAKICIQYQFDTTVYSGGKPQVRAMVQGKKVYDPRIDTAPGAHVGNPSYMVYSPNPALCIVDYILDPILGIGEAATRIDWVAAVAAANLCDETVAVPLVASTAQTYVPGQWYVVGDIVDRVGILYACTVSNYTIAPPNLAYWNPQPAGTALQRRYSCNTVIDCTARYEDNLKTLAAAFQGAVLYSSGKWVLLPGHWIAPTFTVTDDDVAGPITYNTAVPFAARYNAVRGQFYDPANLYQPVEYPGIRVAPDEVADGEGPVWRELQQPSCVDIFEAQRNAMIEQRKSRRRKTWSFPASYGTYPVRPGDFGTLSIAELNITTQYVRCTGWQLDGKAMTMLVNLEEVNPADWFDPDPVLYQTATSLVTPAPANFISDPVTDLTAVGGAGGITFTWDLPAIWHSNLAIDLLESQTNDFAYAALIWSGVNTGAYVMRNDTVIRYYWVQIRNFAGNTTSLTTPASPVNGFPASALSAAGPPGPPGPPGLSALVGALSVESVVFAADQYGHVSVYPATIGHFTVFLGTTDVTSACQFAVAPNGNLSGLQYFLVGEPPPLLTNVYGTYASAQSSETISGGGSMTLISAPVAHMDASLRIDTSTKRWSQGPGAAPPGPVSGTGATSE